ncbi:uncharacterized protein A4U43_C01F2490 [Asparagus officinalis]|uniref:Myb/SANT-like DNA-binding domain-containing protein n=1 Tax=Asparagus officinalis TaxID=4686 RepID=A0A5P1FQV8_ASPOF|nr:uncharacterized protein LOC109846729 [Asparagus officinalis]ONK79060.1 uncharacterized protein A4U43_C01F2490 [Asparagus officinalis]
MDNPMIGSLLFPNPSTSTLNLTSDDDDHHPSSASAAGASASKKISSPWHRMKWTDDVVRLLINLVSLVGDDVCPNDAGGKALQKKGKWKTVSKLMLDKGFNVSPQQCEDKFNDLNKRYKRLNEILGRGTTCQVVENPNLLDSMHHVSEKAKEDVRKILSSKHLFYREMCAYHNGQRIPNSRELEPKGNGVEDDEHDHDLKDSDEGEEDEEDDDGGFGKFGIENFGIEIDAFSPGQKREWLRKRALQLIEERVAIEAEGFALAKRRAKWERFKRKKDWEMERERMENERLRIESERMALEVRKKEMELDMMDGEHGRA